MTIDTLFWMLCAASVLVTFVVTYRYQSLRRAFEESQKLVHRADFDAKQLITERDRLQRLLEAHMDANQKFEEQRNRIWDLYRQSGLQAGNAQSMLLRELQRAASELNVYREKEGKKPFRMNETLEQVVESFSEEHGARRSDELSVGG